MADQIEAATLKVGQFGRLSRLSRKALRLYEKRGLLSPARIDPASGYRYYRRAQVARARRVQLMRLMEMPLETIATVLEAWEQDPAKARRLIQQYVTGVEEQLEVVRLTARLLQEELLPQEQTMSFTFSNRERPAQTVVSIRRHITVPAFHQSIMPTLRQLYAHIREHGAEPVADPLALYYGPVNEEDDGPVEICVPFVGLVPPTGPIKVRELIAHKTVQVHTYGEYNTYPKLLEMWNALGRYVDEQNLEPNWDDDLTTYEIWHDDETMTICWPVRNFARTAAGPAAA